MKKSQDSFISLAKGFQSVKLKSHNTASAIFPIMISKSVLPRFGERRERNCAIGRDLSHTSSHQSKNSVSHNSLFFFLRKQSSIKQYIKSSENADPTY